MFGFNIVVDVFDRFPVFLVFLVFDASVIVDVGEERKRGRGRVD